MIVDAMKSKTSVALLWILVFILGGIAGSVSHYLYENHVVAARPRPNNQTRDAVEGMAQGLNLDDQQKQALRDIIGQSRERYRALSQQMWPQFEIIRNETNQQIIAILNEGQRKKFQEFLDGLRSAPPRKKESRNGKGSLPPPNRRK